jgi:hypothetical protein
LTEQQPDGDFRVKLQSDDPSAFKLCIETLKSFIPVPQRSYDPTTKQWTVDESATDRVHRWLNYATANLRAQVEWLDAGDYEESEAGWPPPPPRRPRPSTDDAFKALFLQPSAPPELVRAAFKCLATLYHPDKGGDEEKMKAINAAYKQLAA